MTSLRPVTPAEDGTSEAYSNESTQQRWETQQAVDTLFDRNHLKNEWTAPTLPDVLGELLDSTHMLPLALPSHPEYLAAWPGPSVEYIIEQEEKERKERKRQSRDLTTAANGESMRSASRASIGHRGEMQWRMRSRTVRKVLPSLVDWVDSGVRVRMVHEEAEDHEEDGLFDGNELPPAHCADGNANSNGEAWVTPSLEDSLTAPAVTLRRHGSGRIPRESSGADTIVPSSYDRVGSITPERPHRQN